MDCTTPLGSQWQLGQCPVTCHTAEAASTSSLPWLWRGAGLWGLWAAGSGMFCTGAQFQGFVSSPEAQFTTGAKALIKAASVGAPGLLQAPKCRHCCPWDHSRWTQCCSCCWVRLFPAQGSRGGCLARGRGSCRFHGQVPVGLQAPAIPPALVPAARLQPCHFLQQTGLTTWAL